LNYDPAKHFEQKNNTGAGQITGKNPMIEAVYPALYRILKTQNLIQSVYDCG
jgi:hypothetical protein